MIKRIAAILLYVSLPALFFVLLGFAVENNKLKECKSLRVNIQQMNDVSFIDSAMVVKRVVEVMGPLEGKKINTVGLDRIQDLVNNMHYVEESAVYRTIDGHVTINIKQRNPVARVVNVYNEPYYIDDRGMLMQTSDRYSAHVMVVTGHLRTRYAHLTQVPDGMGEDKLSRDEKTLKELYALIRYINNDRFLRAWFDHIYVTPSGEFELTPRNGVHIVEFGRSDNMKEKFDKLRLFYQNGLTHVGWNSYNRVNLKFKNQIVCSK